MARRPRARDRGRTCRRSPRRCCCVGRGPRLARAAVTLSRPACRRALETAAPRTWQGRGAVADQVEKPAMREQYTKRAGDARPSPEEIAAIVLAQADMSAPVRSEELARALGLEVRRTPRCKTHGAALVGN